MDERHRNSELYMHPKTMSEMGYWEKNNIKLISNTEIHF